MSESIRSKSSDIRPWKKRTQEKQLNALKHFFKLFLTYYNVIVKYTVKVVRCIGPRIDPRLVIASMHRLWQIGFRSALAPV